MLSSFTTLHKRRNSSKNDSAVTSVHDQSARPVHIIQENKTPGVEVDEIETDQASGQVHAQKEYEPSPFDEVSLSTHSSYQQVPVETVFVCNDEGKILSGNDEFGLDEDAKAVGSIQRTPRKDKGQGSSKETGDGDLSFNLDRDLLDCSVFDRAFHDFEEKSNERGIESFPTVTHSTERENSHVAATGKHDHTSALVDEGRSQDSPKLVEDDSSVDKFNIQAFANIGQAMFKQQPETERSKGSPVETMAGSCSPCKNCGPEARKELFDDGSKSKSKFNEFGILAKIAFAFKSFLALSIVFGIKKLVSRLTANGVDDPRFESVDDPFESANTDVCTEEAFHYAMYQLSAIAEDTLIANDVPCARNNNIHLSFTLICTLILYHYAASLYKTLGRKNGQSIKKEKSRKVPKMTPKSEPKLKREMNSLGKQHVFASTFTTEVVSPTGSISSVKRSSRVKSSKKNVRVDLLSTFELEPKYEKMGMKSKVKAEKISDEIEEKGANSS